MAECDGMVFPMIDNGKLMRIVTMSKESGGRCSSALIDFVNTLSSEELASALAIVQLGRDPTQWFGYPHAYEQSYGISASYMLGMSRRMHDYILRGIGEVYRVSPESAPGAYHLWESEQMAMAESA